MGTVPMDEITELKRIVERAQSGTPAGKLTSGVKNDALMRMAAMLEAEEAALTALNARDVEHERQWSLLRHDRSIAPHPSAYQRHGAWIVRDRGLIGPD